MRDSICLPKIRLCVYEIELEVSCGIKVFTALFKALSAEENKVFNEDESNCVDWDAFQGGLDGTCP